MKTKDLEHTAKLSGISTDWIGSLTSNSVGTNFFQAACLISSSSSGHLVWSQSLFSLVCLEIESQKSSNSLFLERRSHVTPINFRDFLVTLSYLPSFLKIFPVRQNASSQRKCLHNSWGFELRYSHLPTKPIYLLSI